VHPQQQNSIEPYIDALESELRQLKDLVTVIRTPDQLAVLSKAIVLSAAMLDEAVSRLQDNITRSSQKGDGAGQSAT
jgi:hypothetical protein